MANRQLSPFDFELREYNLDKTNGGRPSPYATFNGSSPQKQKLDLSSLGQQPPKYLVDNKFQDEWAFGGSRSPQPKTDAFDASVSISPLEKTYNFVSNSNLSQTSPPHIPCYNPSYESLNKMSLYQ